MNMFARIKQMSLRGKIVVPMVALSVLPAAGIGVFVISNMRTAMRNNAVESEAFETSARASALEEFVRAVETDLQFLSRAQMLNELASARTEGDIERVTELRSRLERELVLFSQGKRSFYQVRYIDGDGREVVRLDVEGGLARAVPVSRLQDKSDRPYVQATLKLAEGELHISPMDLNVERGRVEIPHRPVLRFGMPLFGESGERTGALVLNLNAQQILQLIEPLQEGAEAYLVDQEGTYLGYVGPSEAKRERYGLAEKRQLTEDFSASETEAILGQSAVASHFEAHDALVSFGAVELAAGEASRQWRLVITHSRAQFGAQIRRLTIYLWVIVAVVLAAVARVGMFVADALARPVVGLRQAMSQIAADRGVSVRLDESGPANEIHGLSREFQLMAKRLEQTETRLQGLHEGLAHAEKWSSIGQLTGGIARELSDPLTALKNKVLAAGDFDRDGAPAVLRAHLLDDIEQIEQALSSFSRLTRTPGPDPEVTSLANLVKSVVTLVEPEIHHRGLQLEVDAEPGVPPIKGDLDQLRQLLINLILNAADARPESERIAIEISVVMSDDTDEAVPVGAAVKVVDDGKGIPTDSLVKIWDPFFTTKQDGLGLGLAICRRIVEEHGGRIEVSSQAGLGTAVTVSFPSAVTEAGPVAPG